MSKITKPCRWCDGTGKTCRIDGTRQNSCLICNGTGMQEEQSLTVVELTRDEIATVLHGLVKVGVFNARFRGMDKIHEQLGSTALPDGDLSELIKRLAKEIGCEEPLQ
jgi:RecJ-like exonuclease